MTQEQKAIAYDEVREKIALRFGSNVAEDIFSEFEMSEDEKIRKTLIEYFNTCYGEYYGELKKSDIIAWLEKQEQKPQSHWKPSDEQMKALDSTIDEFDGYKEYGSLVSLKEDLEKLKGE